MAELIRGSVEIINKLRETSEGLEVNTPAISDIPKGLAILRGMTGFTAVTPVPTAPREIGKFTYRKISDDEFERVFSYEVVDTPVADAVWNAKAANGEAVTVLFRETRTMTPDEVAAAIALADVQEQRRMAEG